MKKYNINVNYHSSICINDDIYIDPLDIKDETKNAKIIFITHNHYDHLDKNSILKLKNEKTIFVCPRNCKKDLLDLGINEGMIIMLLPFEKINLGEMIIETYPAYNIEKSFHPKNKNWLGYLLRINNISYYICGDTDLIEEIKRIKTNVLFVPIGGKYTMNAKKAAELTNMIKPDLVIPTHYGKIAGKIEDKDEFIKNLDNIKYQIFIK